MSDASKHWQRWGLLLLKCFGVVVFLWILRRIDRQQLVTVLQSARVTPLLLGIVLTFVGNALRVWRWQMLTRGVGIASPLPTAWRAYHIGIFLATITPAKVGEFGRVAYLDKKKTSTGTAASLLIIERLGDILTMGLLALVAIAFLFGAEQFSLVATLIAAALLAGIVLAWIGCRMLPGDVRLFLRRLRSWRVLTPFIAMTLLIWTVYFVWCVSFAQAVGIAVPLLNLVAAFTIAAAVAVLPIAPSGLGTRDAALITLLTPYGVSPSHAVALSLLLFCAILLSGLPGAWYWTRGTRSRAS